MQQFRWFGKQLSEKLTTVKLVILSDLHYGNPYCSVKHFQRTVDFIKDNENTYCFLNGDMQECAIRSSKGDIYHQAESPDDQMRQVSEWLMPIKDKILGVTQGNHERRIADSTGVDPCRYVAEKMNAPYRSEGMLFKLSFGSGNDSHEDRPYVFWVYFTHGYGGARTKGAKAVKAERLSYWQMADLFAMSHDHEVNVAPSVRFVADPRGVVTDGFLSGIVRAHRIEIVKTNAYVKFGGYAESGGFSPSDLSTPVINLLTPESPEWAMCPDKPERGIKTWV